MACLPDWPLSCFLDSHSFFPTCPQQSANQGNYCNPSADHYLHMPGFCGQGSALTEQWDPKVALLDFEQGLEILSCVQRLLVHVGPDPHPHLQAVSGWHSRRSPLTLPPQALEVPSPNNHPVQPSIDNCLVNPSSTDLAYTFASPSPWAPDMTIAQCYYSILTDGRCKHCRSSDPAPNAFGISEKCLWLQNNLQELSATTAHVTGIIRTQAFSRSRRKTHPCLLISSS